MIELAMTYPADLDQLSQQGATIGRHQELLQGLLEGLSSLKERNDHELKAIMEKVMELAQRLSATSEKLQ
jgi:ABC-type transporter Mla subunit MlaD